MEANTGQVLSQTKASILFQLFRKLGKYFNENTNEYMNMQLGKAEKT